jgi:hypothetical protein
MPVNDEVIQRMIEEERKKIAPEKVAALEATEGMKAMIAVPEGTDSGTYEFGNLKIKHHLFMSRKIRLMLMQAKTRLKDATDPISEQDNLVYEILAEACTEAPWNDPDSWRYADLKCNDGRVYYIFFELMLKMGGDESSLKDFRRKSGGSVSS